MGPATDEPAGTGAVDAGPEPVAKEGDQAEGREAGEVEAPAVRVEPRPIEPAPPVEDAESLIRVGLATDVEEFEVPCCQELLLSSPLAPGPVPVSDLQVVPEATTLEAATYSLQLAALKDESQARGVEAWADERFDRPVETLFDAGSDLYKVRIQGFPGREEAELARQRLRKLGVSDAWIVAHPGAAGESSPRAPSRWRGR